MDYDDYRSRFTARMESGNPLGSRYVFDCFLCGRRLAHHLKRHYEERHSNRDERYCCPEDGCGVIFARRRNLRDHLVRKHYRDGNVDLDQCRLRDPLTN